MSIFNYRRKQFEARFHSRAEAFNAMLAYLIEEEHKSPMEAARQANEFADLFAKNMGLPINLEPEKKGYDKMVYYVKETITLIKDNPELVKYGVPLATFIAGLVTGNKYENNTPPPVQDQPAPEPIDFDKID